MLLMCVFFKQVVVDRKEMRACLVCLDVMARPVRRETVEVTDAQVHKVHLVSRAAARYSLPVTFCYISSVARVRLETIGGLGRLRCCGFQYLTWSTNVWKRLEKEKEVYSTDL